MLDRLLDAFRALVLDEIRVTFLGVYEYTVQRSTETTVDASPASSLTLPAINSAPLVSSLLGQLVQPAAAGARCLIRFVNGSPARPVCVGISGVPVDATVDAADVFSAGPSAASVVLAGGSAPVARDGDAATILLPPAVLVGVLTPPGGSPVTVGVLTIQSAMTAILQGASRASA